MINDILNSPVKVEIDEQAYELEFDNKAYALVELQTGKGLFKLLDEMWNGNVSFTDMIEVFCAAMIKHHTKEEIDGVREKVSKNPWMIITNIFVIGQAFTQPLTPPKIMEDENKSIRKKTGGKKKTAAKSK